MKILIMFLFVLTTLKAHSQQLSYNNFRTPVQVESAMNTLANTYPSLVRLQIIGYSLEGRPIKALKISDNPGISEPSEGDVVFMGAIHAREWITVEVLLYIADRMLSEYNSNGELRKDIDAAQVWIIPISNPDGYQYTHSTYRYWRKNRRNNGDGTYGVDLNRNWGYQWGLNTGSSGSTSDDLYRGSSPFSEPENRVIRDFVGGLNNLKTFVSYHSYSELYLKPWSYTADDPPGESTLRSIAQRNINLIRAVHGHSYSETIGYTSSGETTDFMWEQHRVAAFTPELRPVSPSLGGFSPSPSEILPCAQENYPAAIALLHDAARTGLYIRDHDTDTGAEPSAIATEAGWSKPFWVSPDIWTVPEILNQNATVDLNIKINNATGVTQNNVTLEAYYTDPRISLEFPNPNAILIGTRVVSVPPGGTTQTFRWTIPSGTNSWGELHWCVGAVLKHDNDMPLTTQIQRSSNISCRNFNTTTILENRVLTIAAQNFLKVPAELIYTVDENSLKEGWEISLSDKIIRRTDKLSDASLRKSKLLQTKGIIIEPGETIYLPVSVNTNEKVKKGDVLDVNVHGTLLPLVAGKREAVGNGYTYKVIKD